MRFFERLRNLAGRITGRTRPIRERATTFISQVRASVTKLAKRITPRRTSRVGTKEITEVYPETTIPFGKYNVDVETGEIMAQPFEDFSMTLINRWIDKNIRTDASFEGSQLIIEHINKQIEKYGISAVYELLEGLANEGKLPSFRTQYYKNESITYIADYMQISSTDLPVGDEEQIMQEVEEGEIDF